MKHVDDKSGGFFAVEEKGREQGRMTYVYREIDIFVINHTHVEPDSQGKGLGTEMVMAAVDFARDKNYKIAPTCPFARSVFIKNPELQDVLP